MKSSLSQRPAVGPNHSSVTKLSGMKGTSAKKATLIPRKTLDADIDSTCMYEGGARYGVPTLVRVNHDVKTPKEQPIPQPTIKG